MICFCKHRLNIYAALCADNFAPVYYSSGLPKGVFNYVTGPGSEVGDELVMSRYVSGIVFTGSKNTGLSMIVRTLQAGMQKAFIVEMGGKNPVIVSKNADLEVAASGIVSAAYGYCGQKCSAASRVYVHEAVKEELISKILDHMHSLKIGDPLKKENYILPLNIHVSRSSSCCTFLQ